MLCPNGHEAREGGIFCPQCGAALEPRMCQKGHPVEPEDRFCGECGSPTIATVADAGPVRAEPLPRSEATPATHGEKRRSVGWILGGIAAALLGALLIYYMNSKPSEAGVDPVASQALATLGPTTSHVTAAAPTTSNATASVPTPAPEPTGSMSSVATARPDAGCEIEVPPDEEPIVYYSDPVCLSDFGIVPMLSGNAEYALVYHHSDSGWQQVADLQLSTVRLRYELEDLGMSPDQAADLCSKWAPSDYHCGLERPREWLIPGQFGPDIVIGETPVGVGIATLEESFGPVERNTTCDQWVPASGLTTVEVWAWDGFGILSWPEQGGTVDGYHVLEPGLATEHGLQVGDSYLRIHSLVDVVHEWQWGELNVFTIGDPSEVSGEEYRGGIVSASAKVGVVTQLSGGWDCYTPTH